LPQRGQTVDDAEVDSFMSVRCGTLDAVDDQHLARRSRRLELQSQLLSLR
jgi:hypothetical protein